MREIFKSPKLLADWVAQFVIDGRSLEEDYSLLPDADARRDLEITTEQRDRGLREYSVVRLAGVSLFIKQHYPDRFWLSFIDCVTPALIRHIEGTGHTVDRAETRNALEEYVIAAEAGEFERCANLYMTRLYDDNPHYFRMKFAGIGDIANDQLALSYEVFRDAYHQAMQGMSYESFKKITDAVNGAEGEGPSSS